jgi:hypothetical protein
MSHTKAILISLATVAIGVAIIFRVPAIKSLVVGS